MNLPRAAFGAVISLAALALHASTEFREPRIEALNARVKVLLGPTEHANPGNQGYMINSTVIVGEHGVIHSGIRDAYRRNLTEADARKALDLSKWERHGRAYMIPRNINSAYIEAEAESFEK